MPPRTIFVIDDHPPTRYFLSKVLKSDGYNVLEESLGLKGLQKIKETPPDLVVLDVNLPDCDGFQICEEIKAHFREQFVPVLLVSANFVSDEHKIRGLEGGADAYLTIPIAPRVLSATVKALLRILNTELALVQKTQELERSNRELAQYAYVASHDLREPLRMIGSYIQLFEKKYKSSLDAKADKYINFVVEGARRMNNLIDDLLDYARIESSRKSFADVDLNEVLDQANFNLTLAISESSAKITSEKLPKIHGDQLQMVQLFQNLLANAIKFRSIDSPVIDITFKEASDTAGGKNMVEIVFSDNGIGMKDEDTSHIFEMFQRIHDRGKYAGTGIGLAICRKIIENHEGKIWVETNSGRGSRFHFTLPRSKAN